MMSSHGKGLDGEVAKVFHFTVAQLIDILQARPQNLPVLTSGYENGYEKAGDGDGAEAGGDDSGRNYAQIVTGRVVTGSR